MADSQSTCLVAKHEVRRRRVKNKLTLPIELIREILLRLPVKSVLSFKRVCKSWHSLISDPHFGISHYDLTAAPSHRILFRPNDFYIVSIDTESNIDKDSSAVDLVLPPPPPQSNAREYEFYNHPDIHLRIKPEILGSCRGLVLLHYKDISDLVIWNPSTGVHKRVTQISEYLTSEFLHAFVYDASTDDYLLILIGIFQKHTSDCYKSTLKIFSFKTASWYSSENFPSYNHLKYKCKAGTLLNNALHWLVFSHNKNVPVILVFDLVQRSFSEILLFDDFALENFSHFCLQVGGCLSVCYCSNNFGYKSTEIWVMKEYKVRSSWTKSIVIETCGFSPICITKDGGIIGSNQHGILEKINHQGKLPEQDIYDGKPQLSYAYLPYNEQSTMYRESLLSLPIAILETSEYDHKKRHST